MSGFVSLISVTTATAAFVVAVVLLGVVVLAARSGDSWDTPRTTTSPGDDTEICPRCHHRTPVDATACPECGKSL